MFSIDDMTSPAFHAKAISVTLDGPGFSQFEARIGELALSGRTWRKVRLRCLSTQWNDGEIRCDRGELDVGKKLPVRFVYLQQSKSLTLTVNLSRGEDWQIATQWAKGGWRVRAEAHNGQVAWLAGFLPQDGIRPTAGTWSGSIAVNGGQGEVDGVVIDADFKGLAFADASGLHAGEKIGGKVQGNFSRVKKSWLWRGNVAWKSGEVFWQPFYFAHGGHRFVGQGTFDAEVFRVSQGDLRLEGVGDARLSGQLGRMGRGLTDFDLEGYGLSVTGLYQVLLKPFLEKSAFAKMKTQGTAGLVWRYRDGATTDFNLSLNAANFIDDDQRFALHHVNAQIPWSSTEERSANIDVQRGEVLRLALGEVRVPLRTNGWQFSADDFVIPLLDGKLHLDGFTATRSGDAGWSWRFSGGLTPVSMERFTEALKLPVMRGTLSGVIPAVSYSGGNIKVDGALLFKVFDGTAVVKDLALHEVFGRVPRLSANLDMRNFDLDLLTRAFSFGNIQGRIDVSVGGLELSNWSPVKFDAKVASSPGHYVKKISQSAVQNISALGGAGAAAAIQRSFLSFFEQFGYETIGLSCVLANGACLMDGVESAPQGYVIVKGGGIPAINVIGYNRQVSWDELLERMKRVTQKNVKPVVR